MISGGHYNPAVTLAVFLRGKLAAARKFGALHDRAQLFGAVVAALVVRRLTGQSFAPDSERREMTKLGAVPRPSSSSPSRSALVVLNTATSRRPPAIRTSASRSASPSSSGASPAARCPAARSTPRSASGPAIVPRDDRRRLARERLDLSRRPSSSAARPRRSSSSCRIRATDPPAARRRSRSASAGAGALPTRSAAHAPAARTRSHPARAPRITPSRSRARAPTPPPPHPAPPSATNAVSPSGVSASPSGTVSYRYPSADVAPCIAAFGTRIFTASISLRASASKNSSSPDRANVTSSVFPSGVKRMRMG